MLHEILTDFSIFTARCTIVQSAVLRCACRLSVRLSVTLVDQDHIGWKSWKLITRTLLAKHQQQSSADFALVYNFHGTHL